MPEEHVDITERMQKMGEKFNEMKKTVLAHFKDLEVEVQDWNFAVGKTDKEYTIQLSAKIAVRPKKA